MAHRLYVVIDNPPLEKAERVSSLSAKARERRVRVYMRNKRARAMVDESESESVCALREALGHSVHKNMQFLARPPLLRADCPT